MLHHPKHPAPLTLSVDASEITEGGVLKQLVDSRLQPLAFLAENGANWKPNTVLLMANCRRCIWPSVIFRYFLEGRHFVIFTDHKPLAFAFSKVCDAWSARQQRQLSAISEFTTDVRHIAGKRKFSCRYIIPCIFIHVVSSPPDLDFVAWLKLNRHLKFRHMVQQ